MTDKPDARDVRDTVTVALRSDAVRVTRLAKDINRTNEPGTCLYCGQKLRPTRFAMHSPCLGAYEDNAFCCLRCGYMFGVLLAQHGKRLVPWPARAEGSKHE